MLTLVLLALAAICFLLLVLEVTVGSVLLLPLGLLLLTLGLIAAYYTDVRRPM